MTLGLLGLGFFGGGDGVCRNKENPAEEVKAKDRAQE